jgi:hypothetical protein
MKKMTKLATAALLTFVLMTFFAIKAEAQQTQTIDQDNNVTVNCTNGAYGQNNCSSTITNNASNSQSNTQYVQRANGELIPVHETVNTGMDTQTIIAAISTLTVTGTGAFLSWKAKMA